MNSLKRFACLRVFVCILFFASLFIANVALAICPDPIQSYDPSGCPANFQHVPTNNNCSFQVINNQCYLICDAICVGQGPESCGNAACENVPVELVGLCPMGQEMVGETCSCDIYQDSCSKQCTPICEAFDTNPYEDIPAEEEPVLIPGPQMANDPDVPVQGRLGSHGVNAQGQFTYTVPIAMPPGTNGMQPNLSLMYSSASSNGPVGVGWNIVGVSAIARCPKSYEIDDERGGITFTYEDRFCLNGQRLILINGEYGKSGSEYRLESDNMTKIKAYESIGEGPKYFKVSYPNGAISFYGRDGNDMGIHSRRTVFVNNQLTTRAWALSYIQDKYLNYMRYAYLGEDTGEVLLHKVFYSGHKLSSEDNNQADVIDPYNRVELVYEDRADTQTFYLAGAKIKQNQLLKRIEVYERNELVWNYKLEYETPDHFHHPQLVNIQQCFAPDNYCAPKTSFNWNNENFDGVTYDKNEAIDWFSFLPTVPSEEELYCDVGDPFPCSCEVVDFEPVCSVDIPVYLYLKYSTIRNMVTIGDFDNNGLSDFYVFLPYYDEALNENYPGLNYPEWEGHDRIYLTIFDEESQSYQYKIVKGLSYSDKPVNFFETSLSTSRFKFQDLNGDGKTDIYYVKGKGSNEHDQVFLIDVSTNGVDENNNEVEYAQITKQWGIPSEIGIDLSEYDMDRIKFGDFNGDGNADISYTTGSPNELGINYVCYYRPNTGYVTPQEGLGSCNDQIMSYSGDSQDLQDEGYALAKDMRKDFWDVTGEVMRHVGTVASFAALAFPGGQAATILKVTAAVASQASTIIGGITLGPRAGTVVASDYTRIADFNGDGMSDLLAIGGYESKIYFSMGESFKEVDPIIEPNDNDYSFGWYQPHMSAAYQVGDFNGDGLADVYHLKGGVAHPYDQANHTDIKDELLLSRGDGTFTKIVDPMPGILEWSNYDYYEGLVGAEYARYIKKFNGYRLMDFNGDGRTDLYKMQETYGLSDSEVENGQDTIYHWNGKDHGYKTVKQQFGTPIHPSNLSWALRDMGNIRYGDFNGDGLIDMYDFSGGDSKIIFNRNMRPLITGVVHEKNLGGEVQVDYSRLSDPSVYNSMLGPDLGGISGVKYNVLKSGVYVVKEVKVSNGQGSYLGNRYFYRYGLVDKQGRGFLGFREVTTESFSENSNQDLIRTTTRYRQEYPFTGLVERQKVTRLPNAFNNNEVVLSYTENKWAEVPGLNLGKRFAIYPKEGKTTSYDPDSGAPISRTITETLNDWEINNQLDYWFPKTTKTRTYGFNNSNQAKLLSRTLVEREYKHYPSTWQLGLPEDEWTYIDVDDVKGGVFEKRYRDHYSYYGANTHSASPLAQIHHYYQHEGEEKFYLRENYIWDTFGNATSSSVWGEKIPFDEERLSETGYTNNGITNGRYVDNATNVYDHQSQVMYRKGSLGAPLQIQDANGRIYARALTKDGKVKQMWDEEGSWSRHSVKFCAEVAGGCYSPGAVFAAYSKSSTINPATHTMVEYDELGRTIDSTVYLSDALNDDDVGVSSAVFYDEYGRVVRQSGPKFGHLVQINDNSVDWQDFVYDDLGRLLEETLLGKDNQAVISYEYGIKYDALLDQRLSWTRVIDPNGHQKETYHNALGRIMKVIDYKKEGDNQLPISIRYEYDVLGNMTKLVPENDGTHAVIAEYDGLGRMISRTDPSLGTWTYEYNGLGEIIKQTDAKLQETTTKYDRLGRIKEVIDLDGASTWFYDETELGALSKVERSYEASSIVQQYSREYNYDPMSGRVESMIHKVDGIPYVFSYTYDSYKRPYTMTYPGGFGIIQKYSDWGFVNKVHHLGGLEVFWEIDEETNDYLGVDAYFRPLAERMGYLETEQRLLRREMSYYNGEKTNGLKTIKSWMGWTGNETKEPLQNHFYDYDQIGNLAQRRDDLLGLVEDYEYDGLYRLKKVYGEDLYSYIYDNLGNIKGKSGFGTMQHDDDAHPYQLTQRGSKKFTYDANGNMTASWNWTDNDDSLLRDIEWTSFNKPLVIRNGLNGFVSEAWFAYDAEGNRLFQSYKGIDKEESHLYLGLYEEANINGEWKQVYYIPSGTGETIAQRIMDNGQQPRVEYMLSDHLGSPDKVVSYENGGGDIDSYDFGPFGDRRYDDWELTLSYLGGSEKINRSFTGHTPFDGAQEELVDMNARFYDPHLGRFISPDTILPDPYNTQDLNPYAYVRNNPGTLTDPTGHCPPPCPVIPFMNLDPVIITASTNTFAGLGSMASQIAAGIGAFMSNGEVIGSSRALEYSLHIPDGPLGQAHEVYDGVQAATPYIESGSKGLDQATRQKSITQLEQKYNSLDAPSATPAQKIAKVKVADKISELQKMRNLSKSMKFSRIAPGMDIAALSVDAYFTFNPNVPSEYRMSKLNFLCNFTMTLVGYCGGLNGRLASSLYFSLDATGGLWPSYDTQMEIAAGVRSLPPTLNPVMSSIDSLDYYMEREAARSGVRTYSSERSETFWGSFWPMGK